MFSENLEQSLNQANQQAFDSAHLIQLFDRYATYNGSDPFQTSGIMTLIQHLEGHYGTFVPTKGMVSITESLYGLALKLGVEFSFNSKVEEIIIDSARIQGVQTSLGFQSADLWFPIWIFSQPIKNYYHIQNHRQRF